MMDHMQGMMIFLEMLFATNPFGNKLYHKIPKSSIIYSHMNLMDEEKEAERLEQGISTVHSTKLTTLEYTRQSFSRFYISEH